MKRIALVVLVVSLSGRTCLALINPRLQPWHIAKAYKAVMILSVTSRADGKATLTVQSVTQGEFAPKAVTVTNADEKLIESFAWLSPKGTVVAFAGKSRPKSRRNSVLIYVGGGSWAKALMDEKDPARWTFLGNADAGKDRTSSQILFGTFNGSVGNLAKLMVDYSRGVSYFPAVPFTRFSAKRIGKVVSPGGGAVADLNGDGRLDLLACGRPVRLFIQTATGAFEDQTDRSGLGSVNARSVSVSDANGDGRVDLLLDAQIRLGDADGGYKTSISLPAGVGKKLLSSAFVQIDADGRPDVVISRKGGGLAVLLNMPKGFRDATKKLALAVTENGAGLTGYFDAGDWDGDGRCDLFYAAGCGYVLYQNKDGAFEGAAIRDEGDNLPALGTAAFGYITRPAAAGLYVAAGDAKLLIEEQEGDFADVTRYGNEIQDPVVRLRMCIAEDLNADGTVDLYAAGSAKGAAGFFVANRGYGSFLLAEKYKSGKVIPPGVYGAGATGLAVGDVTGDGANDMLVIGSGGAVTLLVNETLTDRKARADLSTPNDERKRIATRILTIIPKGAGARGGVITVRDAAKRIVAKRRIGGNIGTGCAGPGRTCIAIRQPGVYRIEVRFADGRIAEKAITLAPKSRRHQTLTIPR